MTTSQTPQQKDHPRTELTGVPNAVFNRQQPYTLAESIDTIICDIEGTTTSIEFVHKTLFPYAAKHLAAYTFQHADPAIEANQQITHELQKVRDKLGNWQPSPAEVEGFQKNFQNETGRQHPWQREVLALLQWIREDRKDPQLKALQGRIWASGYLSGAYRGHVYDDVKESFQNWKAAGLQVGIYSSGSVEAQKWIFGYSEAGDLKPYLDFYFDTSVGGKKSADSYRSILEQLGKGGAQCLFLSDHPDELQAARTAGLYTCQILRPGITAANGFHQALDFPSLCIKDR